MSEQDYRISQLEKRLKICEEALYQLLSELSNNREHQEFTRQFDVFTEEGQ